LDHLGPSWTILGQVGQLGPKNLPKEVQGLAPLYTQNV
jgi:hypothetical protein